MTTTTYTPYTAVGDGVTVEYTITWNPISLSFITVEKEEISTGTRTPLADPADYTGEMLTSGFKVTLGAALSSSFRLLVYLSVPITQEQPYRTSVQWNGRVIENSFDKLSAITQQVNDALGQTIKFQTASEVTGQLGSIVAADGGKVFALNSGATAVELITPNTGAYLSVSAYINTTVLPAASEAALKAAINLEIGTDVQAYNAELTNYSADWVDVASATTTDIGAVASRKVRITGTTTITGFGTAASGIEREIRFAGALTLTHNGTSLILPGAANITTAANDTATAVSLGSGNWIVTKYQKADGSAVVATGSVGRHTLWVPVIDMLAATTSGPATAQIEAATNRQNYRVFDFDGASAEYAHFQIALPKSWDGGTITYRVHWSTAATDMDGVAWVLQAVSLSDTQTIDAAWGSIITVVDNAAGAAGLYLLSAESAALTVGGTMNDNSLQFFRLSRNPTNGSDTMAEDARLIGIEIFYTTDQATDA